MRQFTGREPIKEIVALLESKGACGDGLSWVQQWAKDNPRGTLDEGWQACPEASYISFFISRCVHDIDNDSSYETVMGVIDQDAELRSAAPVKDVKEFRRRYKRPWKRRPKPVPAPEPAPVPGRGGRG
ncbi:MAG: hypothetical protein GY737_00130 [Desulfobacteraceae bacterium]|nr:hypothetical protein [Desulfobacteraceae bacterium]